MNALAITGCAFFVCVFSPPKVAADYVFTHTHVHIKVIIVLHFSLVFIFI